MNIKNCIPPSAVLLSVLLVSACSPNPDDVATEPMSPLLQNIEVLDTKPENALAVKVARAELKPGDQATVFGQIGGTSQPFLEGYAGFVLGDTDIEFCNELPGDGCTTPWDACCAGRDDLHESRVSVNFVDTAGQTIPTGIKGFHDLTELQEVVVTGTVAMASTPENLIIEATGLYLP